MKRKPAALAAFLMWAGLADAGDWPMWRYDAARTAASPHEIAPSLSLLWSRNLPPVRRAWYLDGDGRTDFDASYEPVVMGKRLFLGSPNTGSVTAYDTDSGEEIWKVYTEGPVRCALACWKDRVYAGSDDGNLYCFSAETGDVVWKFRGAPEQRPARWILGNQHLISFWPVRGGPVIVDGTVYFGAGIWPIFGVFFHAVDAVTGRAKWSNGRLNFIEKVRVDHDVLAEGGLSPQGHLAALGDKLVVPCGRSMPAGLDLATGDLIYYAQGYYGREDSRVSAFGDFAFVGMNAMVNLYDFREAGSKWAYRGDNPPEGYEEALARTRNINLVPRDLLECPSHQYKFAPACNASSAFSDGVAYGFAKGIFYAHDVRNARLVERDVVRNGSALNFRAWEPPLLWEHKAPSSRQNSDRVIKAGKRIYGYAGGKIVALEHLEGPPSVAWTTALNGTPSSLIAADGKLFVATREGGLYCFGSGGPATRSPEETEPLEAGDAQAERKANDIIAATGIKAGYGLVLGLTDGRLVEALIRQTDLTMIGVDADAKKVDELRRRLDKSGHYGSRVELFLGDPLTFLFPPHLASLMVSEDERAFLSDLNGAELQPLFNILRPYGGTLCVNVSERELPDFEQRMNGAKLPEAVLRRHRNLSCLVRAGGLPGTGAWTHGACDAARTFCAQDDLLKAPLGYLWFGDQAGAQDVHVGNAVNTKVVGGRVYVIQQKLPRMLLAHDAYTGRFLWSHSFDSFYAFFVALEDAVYLAVDGACRVISPKTGETLRSFPFAADETLRVKDLRVDGDVILILGEKPVDDGIKDHRLGRANTGWPAGMSLSSTLVCLDRTTGAERWRRKPKNQFMNSGLLVSKGVVFCLDADPPVRGLASTEESSSDLMALDGRTGAERWARTVTGHQNWAACSTESGIVVVGNSASASAFEIMTGKPVWEDKALKYAAPIMIDGRKFTDQAGCSHDIVTGERTGRTPLRRWGCNYAISSKHLLLVRNSYAEYVDILEGKRYSLRSVRSGCRNNLIPGDGLLNAPNQVSVCTCSYSIRTSFAMLHMPEVAEWSGTVPFVMKPPPRLAAPPNENLK